MLPPTSRLWSMSLVASALAGLAAWGVGEATYGHFIAPTHKIVVNSAPIDVVSPPDETATGIKNSTLEYGLLGAILGLAMGTAGGLARRASPRSTAAAGLGGLVAGGVATAAAAAGFVMAYYRQKWANMGDFSGDLLIPILTHAGIWAVAGAIGGAAFGLGLGVGGRAMFTATVGGLVGGLLGAAIYEFGGAIAFPLASTNIPISMKWAPRLLAALSACLPAALATVVALSARPRQAVVKPQEVPELAEGS